MAHDVFISHSSVDKTFADAVCAKLEQRGIRCWIAPRDIIPGQSWPNAIAAGVNSCRVMVLVFSSSALASEPVESEITLAGDSRKIIIPLKIENISPSGGFQYLLANRHWLDVVDKPLDDQLEQLARMIMDLLTQGAPSAGNEPPPNRPVRPDYSTEFAADRQSMFGTGPFERQFSESSGKQSVSKPLSPMSVVAVAVAVTLLIAVAVFAINGSHDNHAPPNLPPASAGASIASITPPTQSVSSTPGLPQVPATGLNQPTITMTSNPNPAEAKTSVLLTATLSEASNTDGQPVDFYSYDGKRLLGTGILANGVASFSTNPGNEFTSSGTRDLTAVYHGDSANAACTSPVYIQTLVD